MFNKKLKRQINILETIVENLQNHVWQLENPPKHNLKDEVLIEEKSPPGGTHETSGMIVGMKIDHDAIYGIHRYYKIIEDDTQDIITINEKDIIEKL